MATKTYNTRIKNKIDTAANWESRDPLLLDGEIIISETSSGEKRFKIGDGEKTYNELPFQDEPVRNLIGNKVDKVAGKQLSTEDYTTAEKEKLAGLENYNDTALAGRVSALETNAVVATDTLTLNCTL